MAKPVFIVRVENRLWNNDGIARMFEDIQKKLNDYHILMMPSRSETETQFECYNAKDFKEIELMNIQNKIYKELGIELELETPDMPIPPSIRKMTENNTEVKSETE